LSGKTMIPCAILAFFLLLIGTLLNGLVIWILGFRIKRNKYAMCILQLCVANVFMLLPFCGEIMRLSLESSWRFGITVCKIGFFVGWSSYCGSSFLHAVISVLRCLSVTLPLWFRLHCPQRLTLATCLIVWLLAILLSLPNLIFRGVEHENGTAYCRYKDSHLVLWTNITSNIIGFVIPLFFIIVSNMVIYVMARWNAASQTSQLFRILSLTTFVFIICWLPFNIFKIVRLMYLPQKQNMPQVLELGFQLSMFSMIASCCINPLIYIGLGNNMRSIFKKLVFTEFQKVFGEEYLDVSESRRTMTETTISN
uniref:MAS1 proto-onco, G protein-coupled receptor n=1 Tax=Latimeria chalumnae TaxID=7897 RepID=H3B214_LATCH